MYLFKVSVQFRESEATFLVVASTDQLARDKVYKDLLESFVADRLTNGEGKVSDFVPLYAETVWVSDVDAVV